MTSPRVFVEKDIVDIEFTLADDARFNVCLDGQELEEFLFKLLTARAHMINGTMRNREEML